MLALFKKRETVASVSPAVPAEPVRSEGAESVYALAQVLQRDCSGLGLEAAQLRGALDDSAAIATRQTTALSELQTQARQIAEAQQRIQAETMQSQQAMQRARASVEHVGEEVAGVVSTLKQVSDAASRSERVLGVSERLMEVIATCGVETADTPYIQLAQQVAGQIAQRLEQAVGSGRINLSQLFDEHYQPLAGTNPAQHSTAFNALTDDLFPPLQEAALKALPEVVFCIAADRNGYISTHNKLYCHAQRPGDVVWNTANSRWRRIFNDRTGLASARNTRPFLLQTYRRDMGGGKFVMLKEASAPITVQGRHWGGLRLAYRF